METRRNRKNGSPAPFLGLEAETTNSDCLSSSPSDSVSAPGPSSGVETQKTNRKGAESKLGCQKKDTKYSPVETKLAVPSDKAPAPFEHAITCHESHAKPTYGVVFSPFADKTPVFSACDGKNICVYALTHLCVERGRFRNQACV